MRIHRFGRRSLLFLMILLIGLTADQVWAGQVVTDELRQWAREAIARESALEGRTATNTVSILYFENQTRRPELDPLQKGLTLMLITDLSKIETLQVVERTRIQALLDELALGSTGLVDKQAAPRVGRLLGAAYLVGGRLAPTDQTGLRIDSDLVRVAAKDTLGQPTSAGPLEELLRMEKEILFDIVRLLQLELTPDQIEALRKPLTTDLKALMAWFQGVALSDQQKYPQAAEAYQKAIAADPAFAPATEALDELRMRNLIARPLDTIELLERLRQKVSVSDRPEPDEIFKRDHPSEVQSSDVNVRWR
jgi:TolB-like protein